MKQKLTLSIDEDVTARAKQTARQKGMSLSAMVEGFLRQSADVEVFSETQKQIPFSERWRGKLQLRSDDDPRTLYLKKKYGLEDQER